jgi:hypothetical protein
MNPKADGLHDYNSGSELDMLLIVDIVFGLSILYSSAWVC